MSAPPERPARDHYPDVQQRCKRRGRWKNGRRRRQGAFFRVTLASDRSATFPLGGFVTMQGRVFLGRYESISQIGEGGMGLVFLARQLDLDRKVVVKVMHDHIAADPTFRER